MNRRIAFIIDAPDSLTYGKDSSITMIEAAQRHGWEVYILQKHHCHYEKGRLYLQVQQIEYTDPNTNTSWYRVLTETKLAANDFQVIMLRQDPPVDPSYWHTLQLLEVLDPKQTCVLNRPFGLSKFNEKLATLFFPQCSPTTQVSTQPIQLREFLNQHGKVAFKELDSCGGRGIHILNSTDISADSTLTKITNSGKTLILAQPYLPEINTGDKRVFILNGKPIEMALNRIPIKPGGFGNLCQQAKTEAIPLTERDRWLVSQISPSLVKHGLYFVGIDIIGDYITEINVTSPTGICELKHLCGLNVSDRLMAMIKHIINL